MVLVINTHTYTYIGTSVNVMGASILCSIAHLFPLSISHKIFEPQAQVISPMPSTTPKNRGQSGYPDNSQRSVFRPRFQNPRLLGSTPINTNRSTLAVKRDLSFSGLIRRTAPLGRLLKHTRRLIDYLLFDVPSRMFHLYGDVYTHKEMWRMYSYPDPYKPPFSRHLRNARGC
jgi:hypothetical protein